jgi:hypothetical protein
VSVLDDIAIPCEWCKRPFQPQRRDARYCSNTCRADACKARNPEKYPGVQQTLRAVAADGSSDASRVLHLLERAGRAGVHSHELRRAGISGNPSQRIIDLQELGYEITSEREHVGRRPGARYKLVEPGAAGQTPSSGVGLGEAA